MMSSSKRLMHLADEFQPPNKKILSQADVFIKELAKKQQNTVVNLQDELANSKEFCKGTDVISIANCSAGLNSLKDLQKTITHYDKIALLKAAGLGEDDAKLYLDYQKGEDYLLNKHTHYEESALRETISRIKNTVTKYQEKESLAVDDTRLESAAGKRFNDDGLCIKPNSIETKLYKFALENENFKKTSSVQSSMNNIKRIEKDFLNCLNVEKMPNFSKIRRKARKLVNRIQRNCETNNFTNLKMLKSSNNSCVLNSKWDIKSQPITENCTKQNHLYTCSPQNFYTIKDHTIIKLSKAGCKARVHPLQQKLTLDEIQEMPKFQDYKKGKLSKVLYLRNLSNNIKEADLKDFFKDFDKNSEIRYKIMNGKMRGQAFVTFKDEVAASSALDDLNGTFIRNKPIIIQFGHGKVEENK